MDRRDYMITAHLIFKCLLKLAQLCNVQIENIIVLWKNAIHLTKSWKIVFLIIIDFQKFLHKIFTKNLPFVDLIFLLLLVVSIGCRIGLCSFLLYRGSGRGRSWALLKAKLISFLNDSSQLPRFVFPDSHPPQTFACFVMDTELIVRGGVFVPPFLRISISTWICFEFDRVCNRNAKWGN